MSTKLVRRGSETALLRGRNGILGSFGQLFTNFGPVLRYGPMQLGISARKLCSPTAGQHDRKGLTTD